MRARQRLDAVLAPAGFLVAGLACSLVARGQAVTFSVPGDAPDGGIGSIGILEVTNNGAIGDQAAARASLASSPGTSRRLAGTTNVVNFLDSGGNGAGHFAFDSAFRSVGGTGNPTQGNVDNIAVLYRGNVAIPAPGAYTFAVNSDDGFTLAFEGGAVPFIASTNAARESYNGAPNGALQFFGGRGTGDSFGTVNFAVAGSYHFDLTYHEGSGGSAVELMAAPGTKTAFDGSFNLVGNGARSAGTISNFNVVAVHGNLSTNLAEAIADVNAAFAGQTPAARGAGVPVVASATSATVNFTDPSNANPTANVPTRGNSQTFPGDTANVDDNNFSFGARGTLTITAANAGNYTFLAYSDDSSRTRILDAGGNPVPLVSTTGGTAGGVDTGGTAAADAFTNDGTCCSDILGVYNLPAGTYTVESIVNEGAGGSGLFLFAAQGTFTAGGPQFQLLGENLNTPAGLQLVLAPEPASVATLGLAGAGLLLRRRRSRG